MTTKRTQTTVQHPLSQYVGDYNPNAGADRETQLRNVAIATTLGNVFRNVLDSKGARGGANISPITSNQQALGQYNQAVNNNVARDEEINMLQLRDYIRQQGEQRQYNRQDTVMDRQEGRQDVVMDRQYGERKEFQGDAFGQQEKMQGNSFGQQEKMQTNSFGQQEKMQTSGFGQQKTLAQINHENAIARMEKGSELGQLDTAAKYKAMEGYQKQIQYLERSKKTRDGYFSLHKPGPDGSLQWVTDVTEGQADAIFAEIMKSDEALKDYNVLKSSFSGTTAEAKKIIIADHWDTVQHLIYGRDAVAPEATPVDPRNPGALIGLGETKQDNAKGNSSREHDDIFQIGTKK